MKINDFNSLITTAWQLYEVSDRILYDEKLCSVPVHITFGPSSAPIKALGAIVAMWRENGHGIQKCWPESIAAKEHGVPVGTPGLLCSTNGFFGSGSNTSTIAWATGDVTSECLPTRPYIAVVADISMVLKQFEPNSDYGTLNDACRQLDINPQPLYRLEKLMAKRGEGPVETKDVMWGLPSLENAQSTMQRYIAMHNSCSMRRRCRGYQISEWRLNAEGEFETSQQWVFTPDGTPN